jgi:hypothetical protein
MQPKRPILPELIALGISVVVLVAQYPDFTLELQRYAVRILQTVARGAGTAALKLEASYRVKVAP